MGTAKKGIYNNLNLMIFKNELFLNGSFDCNLHGIRSAVWYMSLKSQERQKYILKEKEILLP